MVIHHADLPCCFCCHLYTRAASLIKQNKSFVYFLVLFERVTRIEETSFWLVGLWFYSGQRFNDASTGFHLLASVTACVVTKQLVEPRQPPAEDQTDDELTKFSSNFFLSHRSSYLLTECYSRDIGNRRRGKQEFIDNMSSGSGNGGTSCCRGCCKESLSLRQLLK